MEEQGAFGLQPGRVVGGGEGEGEEAGEKGESQGFGVGLGCVLSSEMVKMCKGGVVGLGWG
jgi:hypothetical protein